MWLSLLQALACAGAVPGCGGGLDDAATQALSVQQAPAADTSTTVAAVAPPVITSQLLTTAPAVDVTPSPTVDHGIGFNFNLTQAHTTSAGVFLADGTLVRTLWRGSAMPAGAYSRSWDQLDDNGNLVADADYTIRVAVHDVKYVWEGVVGNSSAGPGMTAPHRSFLPPSSLTSSPGRMHYAAGYNEAQRLFHGFTLAQPQVDSSPSPWFDPFVAAVMVAADNTRVYWANAGGLSSRSFIAAFELSNGKQTVFDAGVPICLNIFPGSTHCYPDQNYVSVLESRANLDSPPTGLAVQRNGNLLAVAYGGENTVRFYDKVTGAALSTLSVPLTPKAVNQIAFAPSGDLWVLSNGAAVRFAWTGSQPRALANTPVLNKPLAITVDPADEDGVWVADGGPSQQIKRFDRNGRSGLTLGRSGGPAGNAAVARGDKLCFMTKTTEEQTALAVDDNHNLWMVDTCNNRMLQFDPQGKVINEIAYLQAVYTSAVDQGNPTRVFANYLEFAVDYSKALSDPSSWRLVRNWLPGLPPALRDDNSANRGWGGFTQVQTFPNGRTFAVLWVNGSPQTVELAADGSVRPGVSLSAINPGETGAVLYENGDLGYSRNTPSTQSVVRRAFAGFDAAGNPSWAATPTVIASADAAASAPTYKNGTFTGVVWARFPVTSSGNVIFFDPSVNAASGFHLGAVARGGTKWLWQASPSGPIDGLGTFQTQKSDPSIQYGGNAVLAAGRHIVYGFHGEFYTDLGNRNVGQANQFMHFRDDGLFIGQFGVASTRATSPTQAGLSGNAFSPNLVQVQGMTYLYHNDESTHGGIHRWRLDGANAIQDIQASGRLKSTLMLK